MSIGMKHLWMTIRIETHDDMFTLTSVCEKRAGREYTREMHAAKKQRMKDELAALEDASEWKEHKRTEYP